ncbi:hypothetical protein Poly30_07600 [Planctomycetes bacterium Poly30]|uniref:Uncharacterized protein n=1 Tax=Saltatorellus ferox TaxID=2528018 RepID=A0A518EME6_9BACT|nr:hypothetical protein Poly30_07600 [Planctomycetes bacterium Poly30]
MASDSKDKTDEFIESTGAKYAYAYGTGKLFKDVGATGYPLILLVDSGGTILFQGDASKLDESLIAKAVETALTVPLYEWPDDLRKAASSLRKGDLGRALTEVEDAGETHAKIAGSLQGMIEGRLTAVRRAADAGDWLAVKTLGDALTGAIEGRPEVDVVEALLARLKEDDAKDILKAQEQIAKIFERDIKAKQFETLQKKIDRIAEDFPAESVVRRDAEHAHKRLREICGKT